MSELLDANRAKVVQSHVSGMLTASVADTLLRPTVKSISTVVPSLVAVNVQPSVNREMNASPKPPSSPVREQILRPGHGLQR